MLKQIDNWQDLGNGTRLMVTSSDGETFVRLKRVMGVEVWFTVSEWKEITRFNRAVSIMGEVDA
jgi:hypothetical protein